MAITVDDQTVQDLNALVGIERRMIEEDSAPLPKDTNLIREAASRPLDSGHVGCRISCSSRLGRRQAQESAQRQGSSVGRRAG